MTFEERKQARVELQATEEYKEAKRKECTKASCLHQIELWECEIERLQIRIDDMRRRIDYELS